MRNRHPFLLTGIVILAGSLPLASRAQERCGSTQARQQAIAADPHILDREAALETFTQDYIHDLRTGERDADSVYIIPIVFHVLWNDADDAGKAADISNEQIFDQVRILNEDFRKLNADTAVIVHGFDTIAADTHIEFRLATRDPQGNCTNGIHRVRTIETYQGDDGSKLYPWFPGKYLNVWTVSQMAPGVAGYAYYPSAVGGPLALADGVIILHSHIGSIGTASPNNSRSLTHEIGHFLNLQHPWGNNNDPGVECGDDQVEDTPETMGWQVCNLDGSVCNPPIFENVQNYMDYSYCSVMFTMGQGERMYAALHAGDGQRVNLWQPANLALTGTDGITDQFCAPQAAFYADHRFVCVGDPVGFHDHSSNGTVTTWMWSFQDGTPATSNDPSPEVTFSSIGWKTVTLTVGNDLGTDTETDVYSVLVGGGAEVAGLLNENFEDPATQSQWVDQNFDANWTYWSRVDNAGHSGNSSMLLNGYLTAGPNDLFIDDGGEDIDELVSPSLDLSNVDNVSLTFWHTYATQASDLSLMTEQLKVYVSTNCGQSWILRSTIDGTDLLTDGANGDFYVPNGASQWVQTTVNVPPVYAQPDVRFKFVYTSSAYSNNLYLDDIQLNGIVGVGEVEQSVHVTVFPNPATSSFTIDYTLPDAAPVTIALTDLQGRTVMEEARKTASSTGTIQIDPQALGLAAGSYLVQLRSPAGSVTRRVAVE